MTGLLADTQRRCSVRMCSMSVLIGSFCVAAPTGQAGVGSSVPLEKEAGFFRGRPGFLRREASRSPNGPGGSSTASRASGS
jgi:hypothetical protein